MKGKRDGDDGLNPFNLLLRTFNKCVKMDEGIGGRDGRRNSRPPLFPCWTVFPSFSGAVRSGPLADTYLLSVVIQDEAAVLCVRVSRCGVSFVLPEVWVAPCLLPQMCGLPRQQRVLP